MYDHNMKHEGGIDVEALRWAMEQRGWSSARLSQETGISPAVFSLLLQGKRANMTAENLSKIAAALGVSADFILGLSKNPMPSNVEVDMAIAEILAIAKTLPKFRQRDLLMIAQAYRDTVDPTAEMINQVLAVVEQEGSEELRAKLRLSLDTLAANSRQRTFGEETGEKL